METNLLYTLSILVDMRFKMFGYTAFQQILIGICAIIGADLFWLCVNEMAFKIV